MEGALYSRQWEEKKQIFVKRMISPVRHLLVPPPSPLLVENLRFFAELRNVNRKDNLVNYCKKRKKKFSLVLSESLAHEGLDVV